MKCVPRAFSVEREVRRSRFIAHLVPFSEFDGLSERLKALHPKANHQVYAYRHINKYGQIAENSSDDGEPRGCAGQPVLNVLRGAELVETAIIIVRYFGGIKLGTGGMVRAYSGAAKAVIDTAVLEEWRKMERLCFESSYAAQRQIFYRLNRLGIRCVSTEYGAESIRWEVEASCEMLECLKYESGALIFNLVSG